MTETSETAKRPTERDARADEHAEEDHLADVEVGAGCTEIWEHLSESRAGVGGD